MAEVKTKTRASPARKAPPLRRHRNAQTAGTQAQVGLLLRQPLQMKLQVGAANDPAEKEADAVADRVLSGAPPVQVMADPVAAPRRSPMDQPSTDALNVTPPIPAEAAEIDLPKEEDVDFDAMDASALSEIEGGAPAGDESDPAAAPLRRAVAGEVARGISEVVGPMVGPEGGDAPAHVAHAIENPGPGRPLPQPVRADLEPRFGADFSDVRLHDRHADRATAAAIGARAFAYKSDIWLAAGERAEDRRLMAHELTHVLQQTGRARSPMTAKGAARPSGINRFLGDAILTKIESYARHIPGYTLLSLILGKTPLAQTPVQRTPENLIYAVMGLHPLGTMLADKLKETRAIPQAYEWVMGQVSKLNLTWTRIKGVIAKARDLFSILSPVESIRPAFAPLMRDIMAFVLSVKDKVLEFVLKGALKLAGPMAEKVWGVLQAAGETIKTVMEDPLQFAKNLFKSVAKGFGLFFGNFLKHMKKGLLGFIFGALDGVDIQLPDKLDLKGIVSIVFQVLRLTWAHIRKLLVKRLGANGERKVALLEKGVDIIRLLISNGVMAIWQKMLAMIDNLAQTVVGGVIEFLTVTLVKGALGWLAGLSNPVGAVVKVALMIYDFVVMLLERMQQIMEFVKSVFSSIGEIARGNIDKAAIKVEETIGRTVPLILAFLAAIIPISGIASKIQKIMAKLRKPVDKALDKLIKFLVKKAKKVLSKIVGKINGKRKLPATTFKAGPKTHRLYAEKKGKGVEIYTQSTKATTDAHTARLKKEYGVFQKEGTPAEELALIREFIDTYETATGKAEKKGDDVKPDSQTKSQEKEVKDLQQAHDAAKADLDKTGGKLAGKPGIDFDDPHVILRHKIQISEFEGKTGLYEKLSAEKDKTPGNPQRVLQLDHNPSRAVLEVVKTWLSKQQETAPPAVLYWRETGGVVSNADKAKTPVMGNLSLYAVGDTANKFPAMAIYTKYNNAMGSMDKNEAARIQKRIDKKGSDKIGFVKEMVQSHLNAKSAAINAQYKSDDAAVVKNVAAGNIEMRQLAADTLDLNKRNTTGPQEREDDLSKAVRKITLKNDNKRIDFTINEGLAGRYGTMSGKNTLAGHLEADHNPMHAEMERAMTWTLGDMMPKDAASRLNARVEVTGIPDDNRKKAVRNTIRDALKQPVMGSAGYKRDDGAAMVVSYETNQHGSLKVPDGTFFSDILGETIHSIDDGDENNLIQGAKDGETPVALARPIRIAINHDLRDAVARRIEKRQQKTFDLYATDEAKRIKTANEKTGLGSKAVGQLAMIAKKIKSADSTSTLVDRTHSFFPVT